MAATKKNSNQRKPVIDENSKETILLPYTLEVVEILRKLETKITKEFMEAKNSLDLKSLEPKQDIVIRIKLDDDTKTGDTEIKEDGSSGEDGSKTAPTQEKKDNEYKRLANKVKECCKNIPTTDNINEKIVMLILGRIFRYDKDDLWNRIGELLKDGKEICQPFYEFRRDNDKTPPEIIIRIKDYIAIPKDFVAAYFGYDTGIDGLNLLMDGGFLLPPDRSAYISVSGEAGIGKTALVLKLVTSFFQNYKFKNVFEEKDLKSDHGELLSLHYILMEQKKNNIIRLVKECNLIEPPTRSKNVKTVLDLNRSKKIGDADKKDHITENAIEEIIHFEESDWFSPMGLIEKIDSIEKPKDGKPAGERKIIIIDSVNAIQEIDINRSEWRELFQSIKAITSNRNTIVFFIVEKNPGLPDSTIEYLSDVVIKLHKDYIKGTFNRIIELVESRFQKLHHGKHTFYITKSDSGFIKVYPSTTSLGELIPNRKRVKPTQIGFSGNKKEVGIKIDGILNFFRYSHLYETRMEPFFKKNSISMFIGDRGSYKSTFAKKFALSAFRDERWETRTNYIMEFDYREQEPNNPLEELLTIGFWNAKPVEKSIAFLLYFSENYEENPEIDIIWETYFGKVIIPGCKSEDRRYIGCISHIVCSYEVKDLPEDVYLYQLDEFIRALENSAVCDYIPDSYIEFVRRSSISLLNRNKNNRKSQDPIHFNPYNIIYRGDFIKEMDIDLEMITNVMEREIHIMGFQKEETYFDRIADTIKEKIADIKENIEKAKVTSAFSDALKNLEDIQKKIHLKETMKIKEMFNALNIHVTNFFNELKKINHEEKKKVKGIEELIHRFDFLWRIYIFRCIIPFGKNTPGFKPLLAVADTYYEKGKNKKITELLESWYPGYSEEVWEIYDHEQMFDKRFFDKNRGGILEKESEDKFNDELFNYSEVGKIKVSRMVLDDAENLANVYTSLNPQKYISTLSHLCLAREITLGIVNTRSKDETSEVDIVCSAVSDNAFQFDKYYLKGELFTFFKIMRSSEGCHDNMMYYITKRDDGLLQLKNTFALLSHVEKQDPDPVEIRLFLPDLSKEFSKYMYCLLIERDMHLLGYADYENDNHSGAQSLDKQVPSTSEDPKSKIPKWKRHFAKRFEFSSKFSIIDPRNMAETDYSPQEKFPSNYKDWHDFLKDIITYSLAHPKVEIFTANNPFTDISITLEDESAKDAITILCLPGYLMDLYEKNLTSISDYVHFRGADDNVPVNVWLKDGGKWISFNQEEKYPVKFGNEFYYLKKVPLQLDSNENGTSDQKDSPKGNWIIPEIIFNPAIARDEVTNKIILKEYKKKDYLEIKGYPYFIDSRVNLVFSCGEEKKSMDGELNSFIHNTTHDFVAFFFELWFKNVKEVKCPKKDGCDKNDKSGRILKEKCTFCLFEQASEPEGDDNITQKVRETVEEFLKYVGKSAEFDRLGIIHRLQNIKEGERIVLREWYSSAQLKLKALEPLLLVEKKDIKVTLEIPGCFLYTLWYLAIPVNSPRKDTASEIILKMTEPQDLAYLQVSGIGLQLSKEFYDVDIYKSFPHYEYSAVLEAMKNLIDGEKEPVKTGKLGVPIDTIHCYFELLTPFGGMLRDIFRYYNNYVAKSGDYKESETKNLKEELFKKIVAFSKNFKYWQREEKERCSSCYMTYLFCMSHGKKKNGKGEPGLR